MPLYLPLAEQLVVGVRHVAVRERPVVRSLHLLELVAAQDDEVLPAVPRFHPVQAGIGVLQSLEAPAKEIDFPKV